MSRAMWSLDDGRYRGIAVPCVCHGRPYEPMQRGALRSSWIPGTTRLSKEALRPLVELAAKRAGDSNHGRPPWTHEVSAHASARERMNAERVLLRRAERWIEDVSSTLREPMFGLSALAQLKRGTGDLPELAAECAGTLSDALIVLTRYFTILNDAASFHLHIQDGDAILTMRYTTFISRVLRDFFAGFVALAVRRWLGVPTDLTLCFAGSRPTYGHAYRSALPDVSIEFDAPCDALLLSASTLRLPLRLADAKRHAFLNGIASRVAPKTPAAFSNV